MEVEMQELIMENLRKTFTATSKQERQGATTYLNKSVNQNQNIIYCLCQMLSNNFVLGNQDRKLVQIAAANFILKFCNSLLSNQAAMNQRRQPLTKLFCQILNSDKVIHRYKQSISNSLSKLIVGTWGIESGLGQIIFKQTIKVLKDKEFQLSSYLLRAMLNSNPQFNFVVRVKQNILAQYLTQILTLIKQCQIQVINSQQDNPYKLQLVEHSLQILLQYLVQIKVQKYKPLLKEIMNQKLFSQIIVSVLAIAPNNNFEIILSQNILNSELLNRLRLLSFDIICYFLLTINKGKYKLSSIIQINSLSESIFSNILKLFPIQIQLAKLDSVKYLTHRILKFMTLFVNITQNYEFLNMHVQDVVYYVTLPLMIIPNAIHEKFQLDSKQYIGCIEGLINEKKQMSLYISYSIKLFEAIIMKVDGCLKKMTLIIISILQNCINSNCTNNFNQKLLQSNFFNSSPNTRFQSCLLILTSLAYQISNRLDILNTIQYFIIQYETQILSIKDKYAIFMFELFYSFYCELFFKKKQLKNHLKSYFSYFVLLSKLNGQQNTVIRLQAFDTIQNIIEHNNFKSFFSNDISVLVDEIINSQTQQLGQTISLFVLILKQFTLQMKMVPNKIIQWLGILQNKINNYLSSNKSTLLFARYLSMLQQILCQEQFKGFRQEIINFFLPCLHLLDFENQYVDNVLSVVKTYILTSRCSPPWTEQLINKQMISECMFELLNALLLYIVQQHKNQITTIFLIINNKLVFTEQNQDILEAVLLSHLLILDNLHQLTQQMKSQLLNNIIKLMFEQTIVRDNQKLFSKLVLFILIMLRQQFVFTTLFLQSQNNFLDTFYNIAYNDSKTYIQDYDKKAFTIIQMSIIDQYCHIPKQTEYLKQSFTSILEFLQKGYKKTQVVKMKEDNYQDNFDQSDEDQFQQKINRMEQKNKRSIIQLYISPLKQMDQWKSFKQLIQRLKNNQQKWKFIEPVLQDLPPKQKAFFDTMALNIQVIKGQTKPRHIVKIKRNQ